MDDMANRLQSGCGPKLTVEAIGWRRRLGARAAKSIWGPIYRKIACRADLWSKHRQRVSAGTRGDGPDDLGDPPFALEDDGGFGGPGDKPPAPGDGGGGEEDGDAGGRPGPHGGGVGDGGGQAQPDAHQR